MKLKSVIFPVGLGLTVLVYALAFHSGKSELEPKHSAAAQDPGYAASGARPISGANPTSPSGTKASALKELQELRKRLLELEEQVQATTRSRQEPETEEDLDHPLKNEAPTITENEFGKWMTDMIRHDEWDAKRTEEISGELDTSIQLLEDTQIEAVECGSRFCRASLFTTDGEYPDVDKLIGAPPFAGEAFTVLEDDGHVSIYFGPEGTELNTFRVEALANAPSDG